MISKFLIQAVISKYYLGINESVKWDIVDKNLTIDFTTPNKDVIGKITCSNFELENSSLIIYDTKKLSNLIHICDEELLLELERDKKTILKLRISDKNFNLIYALADPLLISKTGKVTEPEWDTILELTLEDINNLIKAKNALADSESLVIQTTEDFDGSKTFEFTFGDIEGHNNKVSYQISGNIGNASICLPFNSDIFKNILQVNKDKGMSKATIKINGEGLMKMEFIDKNITSTYFLIRQESNNF